MIYYLWYIVKCFKISKNREMTFLILIKWGKLSTSYVNIFLKKKTKVNKDGVFDIFLWGAIIEI